MSGRKTTGLVDSDDEWIENDKDWEQFMLGAFSVSGELVTSGPPSTVTPSKEEADGPWFDIPLDDEPPKPKPKVIYPPATNYSKGVNLLAARARFDRITTPGGTITRTPKVKLTARDEDALDDWVRGGWDNLNQFARGLKSGMNKDDLEFEERVSGSVGEGGNKMRYRGNYTDRLANVLEMMQKLPNHEGTTFRRVDPKGDITSYAKKIRPGDYITDMGFSASSMKRGGEGAAGNWARTGDLYFDISGKSGKDISPYSKIGGEAEVLFPPGTTFHVDAIKVEADQTVWVLLTEAVPPDGVAIKNAFTGDPF
jgi:ADP-ribosyltransferase exoenzyme